MFAQRCTCLVGAESEWRMFLLSFVIHTSCGLVPVTVTAKAAAINQTPVEKAADEHVFAQTDVSPYQRYKVAFLNRRNILSAVVFRLFTLQVW